ncbi:hypothetical protein BCS96_11455 [Vibrio breoganii]|uniref:hypothetical protein n=1 Tax=Vibrio breoganii TaxID=553239 RepID=UPI000C8470C2|nr:hypothetical protein [Vibrio breoganii]PMG31200.1 hypothetical protein BCU93_07375 [Vibrio breoganii]PMG90235.1 hypothetical protein BCU81_06855 [Vibrio breoganii]PML84848.1 hypothetical protein BCT68_00545 [Vibrio breoganii]PMM44964.1 hypothetical protein BCT52_09975 [Vibrio breoganii]PMO92321.1 hypothetical protein BCS98_10070 [Vibrio breoganii]
MNVIRYKHNYAYVELDGEDVSTKILTGDTIPALKRNGERVFKPFSGFIDYQCSKGHQLVKLIGIIGFHDDEWHELPTHCYCVGIYLHGAYKLVLRDGMPISIPR